MLAGCGTASGRGRRHLTELWRRPWGAAQAALRLAGRRHRPRPAQLWAQAQGRREGRRQEVPGARAGRGAAAGVCDGVMGTVQLCKLRRGRCRARDGVGVCGHASWWLLLRRRSLHRRTAPACPPAPALCPPPLQPARVAPKVWEDFKMTQADVLGRPRLLGARKQELPAGFVFGKPSAQKGAEPSAGEVRPAAAAAAAASWRAWCLPVAAARCAGLFHDRCSGLACSLAERGLGIRLRCLAAQGSPSACRPACWRRWC
jgi:hypothetical protein